MKLYSEMVEDALIQLSDRKGSSRQALWKYVSAKYPESSYKQFLVRLKKLSHEKEQVVEASRGRYKLTVNYKNKLKKQLEKGSKPKKRVQKTKATMKKSKKKQRKQRKSMASKTKRSGMGKSKEGTKKSGKSTGAKRGRRSTMGAKGKGKVESKRTKGSKAT